jgi:transcriptional antiterminator NusG
MTNTYALNVTRQQEFRTAGELRALGLKPWLPLSRACVWVKKTKSYVWYDRPYVHKLIFCVIPAITWPDVVKLKHVIGKPMELTRRDIEGEPKAPIPRDGLIQFKRRVEAEYDDMRRREANSEYECQYTPGQALTVLSGPFEGFPAVYKEAVDAAHNDFTRLRVSVSVFGRDTALELDPDQVDVV